ncbi:acyltransferase family protein [Psychromonas aquatilis]|uniref:Acyltransferase family protein n=1 Tax=Psychromonas aquatilis TaxID=2005072 RepID=A0ABU9GNG6_9GAMM
MKNLSYRKDISGLRAIAVLLVIFFHIGIEEIPGGFIGVDVFFVLSGFLITSIIYRDLLNDKFTYHEFYLRRIRRIVPVLLFVIILTCIAAWFVMFPEDYIRLTQSAGLSFLSLSNFYFNNITDGYWGVKAESIPLLHTWSLSVEEQFYIIWPATMLLMFKVIPQKHHQLLLLGVTSALFVLSEFLAITHSNSAYYLLPARAFELASGATLALFLPKMKKINLFLNHGLSLLGLSGIILTSLFLSKADVFPGINAAIVCLSTVCLLISGKDNDNQGIINYILSTRLLVFIGLISYSLYLWHWPIIGLINYMAIDKSMTVKFFIILLSFSLSILSYYFIEQKFRLVLIYNFKKTAVLFLAIPFVAFAIFILLSRYSEGFKSRFTPSDGNLTQVLLSKKYNDCHNDYCIDTFLNKFDNPPLDADFLLVGDSHAESLEGFMNVLANQSMKNGSLISNGGTPFLIGVQKYDITREAVKKSFSIKNQKTLNIITEFQGDTVIIAGRYSRYLREESKDFFYKEGDSLDSKTSIANFKSSFDETIESILHLDKKLIIVKDTPDFGVDRSRCPILSDRMGIDFNCVESITLSNVVEQQETVLNYFEEVEKKYPEVIFLDMKSLICDEYLCHINVDKTPLYRDSNHLNYIGAKKLGEIYLQRNTNPL